MALGDSLDPAYRTWLNQLAVDVAWHGMIDGRLEHLRAGLFPSRDRVEADVAVKWGPRRVPFSEIRRIYEWDVESIQRSGGGRIPTILAGYASITPPPGRADHAAEIDPELADRLPPPSGPAPPPSSHGWLHDCSRPLVRLALETPLFRRLCEGVDVPPAPIRRNLETEPRLIGPDGVVRWNKASLLSDAEIEALATGFENRIYTLLLGVAEGRLATFRTPDGWIASDFLPSLLPIIGGWHGVPGAR